jgi:hypothetical protein
MALDVVERCPGCDLVILWGCLLNAAEEVAVYGPILGISDDVDKATAKAGYIGLGSLFVPEVMRELYRCPRCKADVLIEVPDDDHS